MAKSEDAVDLKSVDPSGREGSSPSALTPEKVKELLEEGRKLREELHARTRKMRQITPEERFGTCSCGRK